MSVRSIFGFTNLSWSCGKTSRTDHILILIPSYDFLQPMSVKFKEMVAD